MKTKSHIPQKPACELARLALISLKSDAALSDKAVDFAKAVADLVRAEYPPEKDAAEKLEEIREEEAAQLWQSIVGSKALAKSISDPYIYAMRLRTGEIIHFESATLISSEWVHLSFNPAHQQDDRHPFTYIPESGLDVRISEIVWVMNAPHRNLK